MSKLYGLSEADLRMLKSIVSWYKAGGGGKSGRPTSTRRRPSAAGSSTGGALYRVDVEITAANIDSERGDIVLGTGTGYVYEYDSDAGEGAQKWTKKTGEMPDRIYNIVPTRIAEGSFILTKVINGEIFVDTEAC